MPRYRLKFPQQSDPASRAQQQASALAVQQRQAQTSAYAAARFQEWAAGAQDREALLNARVQNAESQAEMQGAQLRYNFWKDQELRNQTTHYYTAMPQLQEQLRQNGIVPGTARYAAEMSAFASTIPDAITHNDAIRKDLQGYAKVDATSAEITNRLNNVVGALNQAGQRPTSFSTTASGGVDVKATRPIDEGLKTVGLTPDQFLNNVNAKQGKFDDKGNFTQALAPGEQANAIQFQAGQQKDDRSKLITHSMPLTQFNQYRTDLGVNALPAYAAPGQGATPTPNQTPIASPTPAATQVPAGDQQPAIRRYNPETGELE